jgi:hexosaminidase
MKRPLWIPILIMMFFSFKEPLTKVIQSDIPIIPKSQEITVLNGTFKVTANTYIKAGQDLIDKAEQLKAYLSPASGYLLPINVRNTGGNLIELKLLDELSSIGEEGYKIHITRKKVLITAYKPQGIFWGIQTLRQMFPVEILREAVVDDVEWILPCVKIVDKPRFEWRGLMIDYSRTFWNISHTKKYIDAISYYKMNKLHMHLTDDQGWRIEINKYPALTEKASKFDTIYHEPPEREGYYSKEDIRELVRYAEARNVELIPEIEMPGHSTEVFAAYPELSCTGDTLSIHPFFKGPGIHNEIFCAGKKETFEFLVNVLSEVIELFPSKYVHIGGDEAPKAMWKACPDCQRVIKEHNLKDEDELQSWFIKRIEQYLSSEGKNLIGWDEIMEGGLSKTATVMYWRGRNNQTPLIAASQGNDVIMTPTSHCYFDYTHKKISTEKVYSYNPMPDNLDNQYSEHILGVQANFWSHIDRTEPKMDRQIFPRILALSEVGWTLTEWKDWNDFKKRLDKHYKSLHLMGIYYL